MQYTIESVKSTLWEREYSNTWQKLSPFWDVKISQTENKVYLYYEMLRYVQILMHKGNKHNEKMCILLCQAYKPIVIKTNFSKKTNMQEVTG